MRERGVGGAVAVGVALFVVWSNSFIAASYLLGTERSPRRLDALGLTIARFLPVVVFCLFWTIARRRQCLALLRRFPLRAAAASLLSVPAYNLTLYSGQQLGVPAPVVSITTALTPLFVMLLAAAFLGEKIPLRQRIAFAVAFSGLGVIALSRGAGGGAGDAGGDRSPAVYAALLALVALAPLSWSAYTILSKPISAVGTLLDWTFLTLGLGSLPLLLLLPLRARQIAALDRPGWGAVLYLGVLCALAGYAVWMWLLRHLPAATVGFFTFLNPPLTALSKLTLSILFPATFIWQLHPLELAGAALTLAGMALALVPRRGGRPIAAPPPETA
jgi:drug/metabolite transporter (DMT)-like permease